MCEEVTKWLEKLGLDKYVDVFVENDVDLHTLPELNEDDLKELGLSLGHRRALQKAIASLTEDGQALSDLPSIPSPKSESDTSLAAWERHPGERKPVTMLFADITGSTALTEKLDAEEAHDILYGAIQPMCEAVGNYRGTVCKLMGDGIMAMFGAPMASEHHAVDACEAALEMQHAIGDYANGIKAGDASGLRIRVGLHSGEVVVLTVGEGDKLEYDASGPTVPIAARMEQAAEPGEVYITGATHSLAESRIVADTLEPITVKGVSQPVPVYALRRVRPAEEAILDSARTPFVGRRAELNQFRGMLDICIEEGNGQTVYLRGEPGIGKTRLVEEFTKIAAEKGMSTHRGLVLPFGAGKGQDAIRSLVRTLLGIAPGGDKSERQRAADNALNEGQLGPDQAVFINDLLDLSQPTKQRALYDAMDNTTRNAGKQAVVSALVSTTSNNQPLLAIVEDVHWADAVTLAHLSSLTKTVAECPALLVLTSRIAGDQLDRQWLSGTEGSPFFTIELGPLRAQDAIELISEFISSADPLAQSCLERAAGNPLFLEQLLRNVQEGTTKGLPDSIQSLVLARIDRLKPEDKRALQAASVIGQRFDGEALYDLLETDDYDCSGLVEHNLVRPEGGGYLFTHALIQESVYGSLLKRQRKELHQKAAEWFAGSDLVLHAEHLGLSGDEAAPEAFLEAAREEAEKFRIDKAIELVSRGLDIVPESNSFALKYLRGDLLRHIGSVDESIETYREAKEVATENIEHCHASIGIAEGLRLIEGYDEMLEQLDAAEVIATSQALSAELAQIYKLRGNAHFRRGENEACLEASKRCLEHARKAGSPTLEAQSLSNLADAEQARARMVSAHDYVCRCVDLCHEHGLVRILAPNLMMLGLTSYYKNEFQETLKQTRAAVELIEKTGAPKASMGIVMGLAWRMSDTLWADNLTEAKNMVNQGIDIARQVGARQLVGWGQMTLARIALQEGRRDEARNLALEVINLYRKAAVRTWEPMILGVLAGATDDSDEYRSALAEGEKLIRTSTGEACFCFYRDAMAACLQTEEWDEVYRYAQALEDYTCAEPLPLTDFFIAQGRALASVGRGKRDDEVMQELQHLRDEAERVGLKSVIPALEQALLSA